MKFLEFYVFWFNFLIILVVRLIFHLIYSVKNITQLLDMIRTVILSKYLCVWQIVIFERQHFRKSIYF